MYRFSTNNRADTIAMEVTESIDSKRDALDSNGMFHEAANDFRCRSSLRVLLKRKLNYVDLEAAVGK